MQKYHAVLDESKFARILFFLIFKIFSQTRSCMKCEANYAAQINHQTIITG